MSLRGRLAAAFALGALIGPAADQIHLQSGVLSYSRPSRLLWGQALWVPPLFGGASLALVWGHALLKRLLHRPPVPASASACALTLALTLLWGARVAISPTLDKAIAGPLYAILGPLFEAALSSTGAFHYRHPNLLGVPLWLPAIYLHVSLMTREVYFFLARTPVSQRAAA